MRWKPLLDRFFSQIAPAHGGCYEWCGGKHRDGYGIFGVGERRFLTHRIAWAIANGDIPAGMLVLHRCDNPPCINPEHLFLGTDADNARDKMLKGRCWHPTHCPHGHSYSDPANVYTSPKGIKNCRQCNRDKAREYMRAKRAAQRSMTP